MEKAVKKQTKKNTIEDMSGAVYLVKGLAWGYAITCIVFIAYAVILTYTTASEAQIPLVSVVTTAVACVVAGFDTARHQKAKGLMWGMGAGLAYALLLFLIGVLAGAHFTVSMQKLTTLVIAVAGGGIGGILGINGKK